MKVLGIDNGFAGALVLLDGTLIARAEVMPVLKAAKNEYDLSTVRRIILEMAPDHVVIEKGFALPGQGVCSTFSIGHGYGLMRGLVVGLGLPHTVVHPRTWQGVVFRDLPKDDTKVLASRVCGQLWPTYDFRATPKCKKMHEGICDAVLIAEYGRRTLSGQANRESVE